MLQARCCPRLRSGSGSGSSAGVRRLRGQARRSALLSSSPAPDAKKRRRTTTTRTSEASSDLARVEMLESPMPVMVSREAQFKETLSSPFSNVFRNVSGQGGSISGAVSILAGSTIGAGVLALPSETSAAGFGPSVAVLTWSWGFLVVEALLLVELNINSWNRICQRLENARAESGEDSDEDTKQSYPRLVTFRDMAMDTIGPIGATLSSTSYMFLTYMLLVAYIEEAGNVLESMIPFQPPKGICEVAFTLGGGIPLIFGNLKRMDRANQILILALLASFLVICINGTQTIDWTALADCSWDNTLGAIPTAFVTLIFHDLIPLICSYLDYDRRRIQKSVILGSAIPLAMFYLWEAVAFGNRELGIDLDPVSQLSESPTESYILFSIFSILAVLTSFFGSALSGVEFILYELEEIWQSFAFPSLKGEALSARRVIDEDAQSPFNVMPNLITQNTIRAIQSIDASNDRHGDFLMRLLAFTVGIGPPLMVASAQSDIFVFAIDTAGGYGCTVLYGLLPVIMAWKSGIHVPGGYATLTFLAAGGAGVFINQFMELL